MGKQRRHPGNRKRLIRERAAAEHTRADTPGRLARRLVARGLAHPVILTRGH